MELTNLKKITKEKLAEPLVVRALLTFNNGGDGNILPNKDIRVIELISIPWEQIAVYYSFPDTSDIHEEFNNEEPKVCIETYSLGTYNVICSIDDLHKCIIKFRSIEDGKDNP